MKPAIEISNLSKKYQLSHLQNKYYSLRDSISSIFSKQERGKDETFWALKDISFKINPGEIVGIIGSNGAGKSTLLKILSRITPPTEGEVTLRGRVASLLEVGTGFHQELTGRENIFLNGTILGMKHKEIKDRFDEIVEFAGVEKFLDTQVKHYSSGMYMRLAFAVAAHLDSDILIIDEVLAVGDAQFREKSLGRISDIASRGKTVLFVSHNMGVVKKLCQRTILLENGVVKKEGLTGPVIDYYLNNSIRGTVHTGLQRLINNLPKDADFKLVSISLKQNKRKVLTSIEGNTPLEIEIEYKILQSVNNLRLYVDICDTEGDLILRSFFDDYDQSLTHMKPGEYRSVLTIPMNFLGPTKYQLFVLCSIFNTRECIPNPGVGININVDNTGDYNKAYPIDVFRGKLATVLPWITDKK